MIQKAVDAQLKNALIGGITDEVACNICYEHEIGEGVYIEIGASIEKTSYKIKTNAIILEKGIMQKTNNIKYVLLNISGVHVLLISHRHAFTSKEDYQKANIDILKYKVIVIKLGYLYPELEPLSQRSILALTTGNSNLNIESIEYNLNCNKFYPKDKLKFSAYFKS